MKLQIGFDTLVELDTESPIKGRYVVKIMLNCSLSVMLYRGKNDTTPMCVEDFLECVNQCIEEERPLCVDWETDQEPKAWISNGNCNSAIGNISNAHCTIDDSNKSVTIRCRDNSSDGLFMTM